MHIHGTAYSTFLNTQHVPGVSVASDHKAKKQATISLQINHLSSENLFYWSTVPYYFFVTYHWDSGALGNQKVAMLWPKTKTNQTVDLQRQPEHQIKCNSVKNRKC